MAVSPHNGHAAHPTVSIVLPTYQRGRLVGRAIRSVLAQTHGDFELLVVDDGSTDGTAGIVRGLGLPGVTLISQPNAGKPAALNRGIAGARYGILVLVEGRWDTGAGLGADEVEALVGRVATVTTVTALDDPALWGREITDERFLVVAAR